MAKTVSFVRRFVKKNAVMTVALVAAVITSFVIPPDKAYLGSVSYTHLTLPTSLEV